MVEALKKIDKKILIIVGLILFSPILVILFLLIFQGCNGTNISYEKYEDKMISAAERYFGEEDKLPEAESEIKSVKLSKLVSEGYIKSSEDLINDKCTGKVTVRRNGKNIDEDIEGYLSYTVNLSCDSYKTQTLNDSIKENLTTSESGLYNINDEYLFKGEYVNNYLNFFGSEYRIIKIDKNGVLKLIKSSSEASDEYWDAKYNIEADDSFGKNIYKDSFIINKLKEDYNNEDKFTDESKKYIVSQDICIYSKDVNDNSIQNNQNCSSVLENQFISLLDINDFANASLDVDCISLNSRSCKNYNYLNNLNLSTWTYVPVSNNTYDVYYYIGGILKTQKANRYNSYNLVIYIDGNMSDFSGSGKESDPYVIK